MRVFLSYGRDEYAAAAERIRELLTARGHEVWFDRDQLVGGVDWERSIEQGLEWVANDSSAGRVVLVMTPHSVRRPDGYCLNELARALQRQVPILPVMLVEVEPPLSICRLQWVDMRHSVPLPDRQTEFDRQAEALMLALERGAEESDGSDRLAKLLQPIAFDYELSTGLRDFTVRQWIIETVDDWLHDDTGQPVLWISGGVGTGKTSIALWLAANRAEFAAWHFCRYGHSAKADARRCVKSIAYQLSTQLPAYADQLSTLDIRDMFETEASAVALFDLLVLQPLSRVPRPDRSIVALVDALDEATIDGRNELCDLIGSSYGRPGWLRFLVTSRPEAPILSALRSAARLDLDAHERETEMDIAAFVTAGLQDRLPAELRDGTIAAITERAGGSFLYASAVVDDIRAGRLVVGDLTRLPTGLTGVFWRLFEREFPDVNSYRSRVRPLLELLVAERAALPLPLVAETLNWGPYDQQDILAALGSLCVATAESIQPFHASLVEWLIDRESAGQYWVNPAAGHERLATVSATQSEVSADATAYLVENAADHMIEAGKLEELAQLLSDFAYLKRRLQLATVDHEARRLARSAHRDDVAGLASLWPAAAPPEPITQCLLQFAEVGWRVVNGEYEIPDADSTAVWQARWDEGAGLHTSAVYLAGELANSDPRWIHLVPLIIGAKLHKFLSAQQVWFSISDGAYWHLHNAVSTIVNQLRHRSQLTEWAQTWTPLPIPEH